MFKKPIIVLDIETTGVEPWENSICELAAVFLCETTFRGVSYFNTGNFIKPIQDAIYEPSMEAHRISREEMSAGPSFESEIIRFEKWIQEDCRISFDDVVFATWGIDFDIPFLKYGYKLINRAWPFSYRHFDIRSAAVSYCWKHNLKFSGLYDCLEVLGMAVDKSYKHRALNDSLVATEIFRKIRLND